MADHGGLEIGRSRNPARSPHLPALRTAAIGMQKQPPIAAVHHGNAETHEARRAIAQFMGDPVPLRNSFGAEQCCSNFAVGRAVETAIECAQGEDESVSPRLRKSRWVGARTAAVERAPKTQRSGHPDFKQPIERQKNRSRICARAVQMHAQFGAEPLDDIVVTFSGQYRIKRHRLGLESWMPKLRRQSGQGNDAGQSPCCPDASLWDHSSSGRSNPQRRANASASAGSRVPWRSFSWSLSRSFTYSGWRFTN